MKVHIVKPFDLEKNLGRAYNEAMSLIPEGDWACLMDYDTMFLTPETIPLLYKYIKSFPDAGMFTCYTNRIHPLSDIQLLDGKINEDNNVLTHINIAEELAKKPISVTEIHKVVSGFLMLVSRDVWDCVKFTEDRKCLGVDNIFCQSLFNANLSNHPHGASIYRMDNVYVWHTYRLNKLITDKTHLL